MDEKTKPTRSQTNLSLVGFYLCRTS